VQACGLVNKATPVLHVLMGARSVDNPTTPQARQQSKWPDSIGTGGRPYQNPHFPCRKLVNFASRDGVVHQALLGGCEWFDPHDVLSLFRSQVRYGIEIGAARAGARIPGLYHPLRAGLCNPRGSASSR
jgi:hypothetical protein